jgi:hypothetical protein
VWVVILIVRESREREREREYFLREISQRRFGQGLSLRGDLQQ